MGGESFWFPEYGKDFWQDWALTYSENVESTLKGPELTKIY
jgi:hypothetical protein